MSAIPPSTPPKADAALDPQELMRIIAAYDQATEGLKKTHDSLRAQVAQLNNEVQQKNAQLTASLEDVSALKNYLANILESINEGVIAIGPDRRIVAFNHAAAAAVLPAAGDPVGQLTTAILPGASQELGRILERVLAGGEELHNLEIKLGGETERLFAVSASLIRNARGETLGAVETFRDLTDLKRLEEKAARQDRLAALGEMAAGVAHEIRNPLGGIELYASTLQKRLAANPKDAGLAGKIVAAAGALNRIVSDMLTFTRERPLVLRQTVVERVCAGAADLAAKEFDAKNLTLTWRHALGKRPYLLDPDQLTQALLNILLNAAQFSPDGSEIIGSTYEEASGGSRELCLAIEDAGSGISAAAQKKLFNPFFTTRQEGTGLGLAITHKILREHNGSVNVENRPPRGACFILRLPVI